MSAREIANQPPVGAFMADLLFDFGDIRTAAARLAATGKHARLPRLGTARKAVSLYEPTALHAPRSSRTGGVGKRRRVDPGNGTMSPV